MNPALSRAMRVAAAVPVHKPRAAVPRMLWRKPVVVELVPLWRAKGVIGHQSPALVKLLDEVAQKHGLSAALMQSDTRQPHVTAARLEFYYRAAAETTKSLNAIGRVISRDHSSVRHGIGRYCEANGLPCPRNFDFIAEAQRRRAQCSGWHRRKMAERMTMEQGG